MIKFQKSPIYKFWRLPIEPSTNEHENIFGVAVMKIQLFNIKFLISEESQLWLMSKISGADYESIINLVIKKVLTVKIIIDVLRIMLFIVMILTLSSSVYFYLNQQLALCILLAVAGLLSMIFQKIMCICFIKVLKMTELSLLFQIDKLNQWLKSQNRKILLGQFCFWIRFEVDEDFSHFNRYELESLSDWINCNLSESNN